MGPFQGAYPESFDREQGFTPADWLRCLPGAVRQHPLDLSKPCQALVRIGDGCFTLTWQVMPPRGHGLMRMPRMAVQYRFAGVDAAGRAEFMRYFDLYTMRGGG